MSEVSVDAAMVKRTQEMLGQYVKKPVLSEKLLRKPPFRFLHDVVYAVIRNTGVYEGLYTPEELNVDNINDREAKMKFLQKIIDATKITTNEPILVKPSKIVAGHEPEKTNELLQLVGKVIEKKLDWKPAVEQINSKVSSKSETKLKTKEGVKEKKPTEKSSEPKKVERNPKPKPKEGKTNKEKSTKVDGAKEKKPKTRTSSKEPTKKITPEKVSRKTTEIVIEVKGVPQTRPQEVINSKAKEPKVEKSHIEKRPVQEISVPEIQEISVPEMKVETPPSSRITLDEPTKDEHLASKQAEEILLTAVAEDEPQRESRQSSGRSKPSPVKPQRSIAEKSSRPKADEVNLKTAPEPTESLQTVNEQLPESLIQSAIQTQRGSNRSEVKRESTFVRENSKDTAENPARSRSTLRPPSARPPSARPGAPRRRDKNVEIILQPNDQIKMSGISVRLETFASELEDDGENLVVIEDPHTEDPMQGSFRTDESAASESSLQQGHLVQQILETQKELVHGSVLESESTDKDYELTKPNTRQSSARQMNGLRDIIQNLTKSINPLGKLMDFIPEDIDAMQLEMTMWRDTYNQASAELKKERSLTESVTEPMKNQLITIESTIKEYQDMINECRAKILQNSEKIQKLFTTQ